MEYWGVSDNSRSCERISAVGASDIFRARIVLDEVYMEDWKIYFVGARLGMKDNVGMSGQEK